ncbi:UDP-glucose 6-dehydrogenase [Alteripontixanthobacter maritimus]|uniref:UDP-glucose 6-dehydrogenase n=1 Tax=Alteripontixanthobacter maritimus TaxID=2161824 RepID=A0A369QBR3_9SPHN|nr:UDP-N-acetyl-D-mannosamine dehydrogenase [Alteripontixanthobacter maritimus]RDC59688.1 UDP-glucose 6-dehydrogenase [Alteripontixanthobacter maritimus]
MTTTDAPQFDVAMIGLGYIGLPTAAVIARSGLKVRGVDVTQSVVDTINSGAVHIEEKDLDELVHRVVESGHLSAATQAPVADVYLIAVPTPFKGDNQPDISFVLSALRMIAPQVRPGACVILESTSPVGTTAAIAQLLAELRPDLAVPGHSDSPDIAVAYCPERVLPGKIIEELVANDRVIGGLTDACSVRAAAFYRGFVDGECVPSNAGAAEMVKLSENSFRDVNIAFANELSLLAEEQGIDVWEVIRLANRHPRVNILQPGPGVGGHCIAVDPWFLVAGSPETARIIRTAREVNDAKAVHVANRMRAMLDAAPDAKLALLGLAFKPNIDDFRESPALEIAEELATDYGPRLLVVEPFTTELPGTLAQRGAQLVDYDTAMDQAELVGVLVDHDAFKDAPRSLSEGKITYDTRGMWA